MDMAEMDQRKSSVQRVKDTLEELNITTQVKELPESTRTALEAAKAVDCDLGQIVKSLVFQTKSSLKPILILTSGANKVDEEKVEKILGEEIKFASARFVREETGFAIGGVSPYGLKKGIPILIDEDLLKYEIIWAAAGSHNAVFSIAPRELKSTTNGRVISVV
jgi:prolyl-tRNA editing enzyme YbaK/EbsC (Cys-tRNA(Pro) deacylase)